MSTEVQQVCFSMFISDMTMASGKWYTLTLLMLYNGTKCVLNVSNVCNS